MLGLGDIPSLHQDESEVVHDLDVRGISFDRLAERLDRLTEPLLLEEVDAHAIPVSSRSAVAVASRIALPERVELVLRALDPAEPQERQWRAIAFRSWRMIGRVVLRRATVLKPARLNAAAVPVKTLDELAGRAVSTG